MRQVVPEVPDGTPIDPWMLLLDSTGQALDRLAHVSRLVEPGVPEDFVLLERLQRRPLGPRQHLGSAILDVLQGADRVDVVRQIRMRTKPLL